MKNKLPHRKHPRGLFTADILLSLIIIGVLLAMFVTMTVRQQQGLAVLKAKREAARLADRTLLSLRAGIPAESAGVRVRPLSFASETPGFAWVEVTASVSGRAVTLVGMVPAGKEGPHAAP